MRAKTILLERIYDDRHLKGYRVLVDRLWPRGGPSATYFTCQGRSAGGHGEPLHPAVYENVRFVAIARSATAVPHNLLDA